MNRDIIKMRNTAVKKQDEKHKLDAAKIDTEIEELRLRKSGILEKIKGVELVEYKKQILGQNE